MNINDQTKLIQMTYRLLLITKLMIILKVIH